LHIGQKIVIMKSIIDAMIKNSSDEKLIQYKELIKLRAEFGLYKMLDKKLQQVLNAELEIEDLSDEVYNKLSKIEVELDNLKMEMNLSDEEWNVDEDV